MSPFLSELRRAGRALAKAPAFTLTVLATFALGIGVNTAVFSAAWSALLAPLPLKEPGRVVAIWETFEGDVRRPVAPANFLDWRREAKTLEGAAAYFDVDQVLDGNDGPRRISVAKVSSQFFDVLGVEPSAGRFFRGGETSPAAVVGRRFWDEELGGGPLAGRQVRLDGETFDVVALAPDELDLPAGTKIWTLAPKDVARVGLDAEFDPATFRDARYLGAYARLAPGATLESANAELATIAERLEAAFPTDNLDAGARVYALADDLGHPVRGSLLLLGAGALAILLIACANVAGLLLARGLNRQRDFATLAALGASHLRMVWHSLAESALLACGGGVFGLVLAAWGAPRLLAAMPQAALAGRPGGLPTAVLAVAGLLLLLTAAAAALAPALAALRVAPAGALTSSRGSVGAKSRRLRAGLVVTQAGLAVLMVAGALLIVRTLGGLLSIDPGFRAEQVTTLRLWTPSRADFPPAQRRELLDRAVAAAAETPGVASAGAILKLPLTGAGFSAGMRVEGQTFPPGQDPDVVWRVVTADYFSTLGIPLRAGRYFTPAESEEPVAIVNETLARRFWPEQDAIGHSAIGRRIETGLDGRQVWTRVVGVVGDTPQDSLRTPARPEMYRPLLQNNRFGSETVALAVRYGPGFELADLRANLRAVSPELVLESDVPLAEVLRRATARERLLGSLLGLFGGLALLLAGIGLYGVLTLLVAERRRELGIRLAVGATSRDLVALVLRRGAAHAALGAVLGLAAALALGRTLSAWLWQVSPADPLSLAGAVAALFVIAGLAAVLPARRAARTEPASVLRED
jgi:putative ABC transport system permease protein